jgi:peptidoglycan/xylan/chitin deacetylase (PgdA/CDA1 family)/GT2 family glycosyltransferase
VHKYHFPQEIAKVAPNDMRLSVVLPTYNRCSILPQILAHLLEQDFPAEDYEIIVVDDGSNDGTESFLKTLKPDGRVRQFRQHHAGPASAREVGIQNAQGEFILMFDDDLLCDPGLITAHLRVHRACGIQRCISVGMIVEDSQESAVALRSSEWLRSERESMLGDERDLRVLRFAPNSCASRAFLLEVGGYDENFAYAHEDAELGFRLFKAGASFIPVEGATVRHLSTKSETWLTGEGAELGGAAEVSLCRKHPEYRPYSSLARLHKAGSVLSCARPQLVRFSVNAANLFGIMRNTLARDRRGRGKLLGYEYSMRLLRSAIQSCGGWKRFRDEFWRSLPVLLYHNVAHPVRSVFPELTIAPEVFAAQMIWLKENGYTTITPSDWGDWRSAAVGLPERPVLITFDDAYQSLVKHAFPVLESLGFQATVFVPTGHIGGRNEWDRAAGAEALTLMNADQIREWAQKGINFGGHSRSHIDLASHALDVVRGEVEGCADDLVELLGVEPSSFAYPWGVHTKKIASEVRRRFRLAFTTQEGLNDLATEAYSLRRTVVLPDESLTLFKLRVRCGSNPLLLARSWLRSFV